MVLLIGKNLGERQRDLNTKVAEVIANEKSFEEIKNEEEATDIDKLYKIDVASHYEDVNYILEILKSGDTLHISRALKCTWLYKDNYNHIINPENLNENVFPFMSIKMKKKMLSTISMYIRNNDRAAAFFIYCEKNQLPDIALKFLNFTSEEFKINILKERGVMFLSNFDTQVHYENFIGNSFAIASTCLELRNFYYWHVRNVLYKLLFLYNVNNEKYLDFIEKYESVDLEQPNVLKRLGLRISKHVMKNHKERVLNKPLIYTNLLNKKMLVKYSTIEDAKTYLTNVMPQTAKAFWKLDFCKVYNYLLSLISTNERFKYIKELFGTKYQGEGFEMTIQFYNLKYYEMLSIDERELWALRHIDEQKEILGSGNDYVWYKFVSLNKSLTEIKKYIMITPDKDKRSKVINILVESARDQKDLIKVLNYYYDRHINESDCHKEAFIDKVLQIHNVFKFNPECWEALNKLFYSLEIYTVGNYSSNKMLMAVAVCYHILHKKDMPQALKDFIELDINYLYFEFLLEKLGEDSAEVVFQYLLKLNIEKLKPFEQDPFNKKLRRELKQYCNNIFTLLSNFRKDDKECPAIAKKFIEIDSPKEKEHKVIRSEDIFRLLKKDASMAIGVLQYFDENIENWPRRFNNVLRKLKVYFQHDVAQEYIKFLDRWLLEFPNDYSSYKLVNAAVFGLFQLGDDNFKVTLMEKYKPTEPKIDHSGIDRKLLYVQEAICRLVGYSRPPVPLENVLKYIKGDYVQYCLPMFNMYLVNLPWPQAIKFTESILDAPLSIQKHGLCLAFKCFTIHDLKCLVLNVWKKTKNVSLRMILYKALVEKITKVDESGQIELYEVLKLFTLDLHQDDQDEIFTLITSNLIPDKFTGDYLRTSWYMVIKLPEKSHNINRQIHIVNKIAGKLDLVGTKFAHEHIIEKHVDEMLEKRLYPHLKNEMKALCDAKWRLTAAYIVHCSDSEELKQRLDLLTNIFEKCLNVWNEENFVYRRFYFDFIQAIRDEGITIDHEEYRSSKLPIFQHILDMLLSKLPMSEIYLKVWDIQLTIYAEISANNDKTTMYDQGDTDKNTGVIKICVNFANQIGNLVKDLLKKQKFYPVFLPRIADLVKTHVRHVLSVVRRNYSIDYILCESLVNLDMKETHLLALLILPNPSDDTKDTHTRILTKIQTFENEEVQSFLFSRFCDNLVSSVTHE